MVAAANNQLAAAIAAHPTRFGGFATLPMVNPAAAADELERAVQTLGMKGAMINGTTKGRFLDDAVFLPILSEQRRWMCLSTCTRRHLPHRYGKLTTPDSTPGSAMSWRRQDGWHSEVGLASLRLILSGVFDRLPGLQMIIGHMGEMLPFMLGRIQNVLTPVARHLQRPVPHGTW